MDPNSLIEEYEIASLELEDSQDTAAVSDDSQSQLLIYYFSVIRVQRLNIFRLLNYWSSWTRSQKFHYNKWVQFKFVKNWTSSVQVHPKMNEFNSSSSKSERVQF